MVIFFPRIVAAQKRMFPLPLFLPLSPNTPHAPLLHLHHPPFLPHCPLCSLLDARMTPFCHNSLIPDPSAPDVLLILHLLPLVPCLIPGFSSYFCDIHFYLCYPSIASQWFLFQSHNFFLSYPRFITARTYTVPRSSFLLSACFPSPDT